MLCSLIVEMELAISRFTMIVSSRVSRRGVAGAAFGPPNQTRLMSLNRFSSFALRIVLDVFDSLDRSCRSR